MNNRPVIFVISLGITAAITQFVMMREFLTLFSQNELILGVILGSWTILTGIGAFLGRFFGRLSRCRWFFSLSFLLLAVFPSIQFVMIRTSGIFFVSGAEIGPLHIFLFSLLFLLPFCLLSGLLLNLFSEGFIDFKGGEKTGRVYLWDVVGDIIGGIVFSFLFVYFFSSVETLFFLCMLNLVLMGVSLKGTKKAIAVFISIVALITFLQFDIEKWFLGIAFSGHEILYHESNPYGKLTVTKKDGQINFFENGKPFSSDQETISKEEGVHYGLSQVKNLKTLLLVGGAFQGVIEESLKYKSIDKVDYVEKNPWLTALYKKFFTFRGEEKVSLIIDDPGVFIRLKEHEYDAILINLPPPATANLNRYYTYEFFEDVKGALRNGGVFSFSLPSSANYSGERLSLLTSSVYKTLKSVFPETMIVPGGKNYFIASNIPLIEDISYLIEQKNIDTRYTNEKYLKGILTEDRMASVKDMAKKDASINYDFRPSTYFIHLQYWFERFGKGFLFPIMFIVFAFFVSIILFKGMGEYALTSSVYSSGFSGMGLQIILLVTFQISHGYLYNYLSVLITALFIGTLIGAIFFSRFPVNKKRHFVILESMLVVLCLILPVFFLSTNIPPLIFAIFNLSVGFILGAEFVFVSNFFKQEEARNVSAYLFVFDFLGSSIGAFVIGAFVIPLVGMRESCFILGFIKLFSLSLVVLKDWSCRHFKIYERFSQLFLFVVLSFVFVSLGGMIYFEDTGILLYGLSLSQLYLYLVLILLGLGLFLAMDYKIVPVKWEKFSRDIFRLAGIRPFTIFNFFIFSFIAFFPIFRCYFKVPYVFCHVCPRKCVFGVIRPYLVPAALLMNIRRNSWCYSFCPLGTLQECHSATFKTKKGITSKIVPLISYSMFIAIGFFYFKTEIDFNSVTSKGEDWHTFFFKNNYTTSVSVIIAAFIILWASIVIRRSFCNVFCPVNVVSRLRSKIEMYWFSDKKEDRIYE